VWVGKEPIDAWGSTQDRVRVFADLACLDRAPDIIAQVVLLDDLEDLARLCLLHKLLLSKHPDFFGVCMCPYKAGL